MKKVVYTLLAGLFMLTIISCEKEETTPSTPTQPAPTTGSFKVKFEHVWGNAMAPFELNTPIFHPMTGDTLTFTKVRYYVSNIGLKNVDGTMWYAEESYHLLDASNPASLEAAFADVPNGTYTSMVFTMGVDSVRNVSGVQEGALDPANGMFWSWNTGYIMIKAEGTSPQASSGNFLYHLGGFYGPNKAVMEREVQFMQAMPLSIEPTTNPAIHMLVNPARLFHTVGSVSNGDKVHMPGVNAGIMARDFQDWVRFDQLHL